MREAEGGAVALIAYFAGATPRRALGAALPSARVESAPVAEVDWVARFRESFRPFRAGRFRIAPAWAPPRLRRDVLLVEPGRAFGTGTHETTRLCLAALESLAARRPLGRVLDVGTGTGLLAIAAGRLGAREVVACDIDSDAIESARRHASLNGAAIFLVRGDGGRALRRAAFDLVLANLTAAFLVGRRQELTRLVAPRGILVLSGLLGSDLSSVQAAYRPAFSLRTRRDGEWVALVGRKAGR